MITPRLRLSRPLLMSANAHPTLLGLGVSIALGILAPIFADETAASGGVKVEKNIMVPMRDTVRLATDLYLPAKGGEALPGRQPVILTRTPYGKDGAKKHGEYFASHGYVFVAQDTRGRYASEGVWHWMTDDGRDGADCAAWIASQPWCDGKIGMIGTSYVGGTQHAMAMEQSPHLTTVIPVDAVSNLGRQSMRNAGAFRAAVLELDHAQRRQGQPRLA